MADELVPVNLSVSSTGRVSVLMLLEVGQRHAIYEGDKWKQIGETHRTMYKLDDGKLVLDWVWYYDEIEWGSASGHCKTRPAALAAILNAGGYRVVDENATIPDLLEGLT